MAGAAHNSSLHPETRVFASDSGRSRIWPPQAAKSQLLLSLGAVPLELNARFFLGDLIFGALGIKFKDMQTGTFDFGGGQVVYLDDVYFYGPPKPHTPGFCASLTCGCS